ncbi:MAG: hypothetical protein ACX939_02085 [Hyphococcus sp.]
MRWLDARRTHTPVGPFDDDPVTRVLLACAFLMIAMFVVVTPPWLIETRLVEGVNVWTKPQKFHVSLLVHFVTLAILAQTLPREIRAGPTLGVFAYLAAGSLVFESVYIIVQAARGRRSHFNFDTPIEATFYALMGLGALLLITVAIVLGMQIWRKARSGPGLRIGAAGGLIIGGILTIILAGYMSSVNSGRWVGEHPVGGAVAPFFGWSREVGDLRPSHFVAMHMMQTLPLIGWLTDLLRAGPRAAGVVIAAAAAIQIALALFLFFQALAGEPFWPV